MFSDINASPSVIISPGLTPTAELKSPPDIKLSSTLSSVGVRTLSSSKGISSTFTPLPGALDNVKSFVDPSPLNTSAVCLVPSK